MSEANERDVQLLEKTLATFENVAEMSRDQKIEDTVGLKLAELHSEELERAARIIYKCKWDINHANDRDQNLKTKDIVDRISVIVQKLHQIFKELSKKEDISFPELSQSSDSRYGSDRGEKGENLAQSVATALRWYADGCKRKVEKSQEDYSNPGAPRAKVAKQASEEWDLPRIPVIKGADIGPEEIKRQYDNSTWAAHVNKIQELFAKK